MKTKSQCFVAGKSGGHIIPCLTLARHAKIKKPKTHILFFSTRAQIDNTILDNNGIIDTHIALPLTQLKPKKLYQLPITLWHLIRSFFASLRSLIKYKPERVISTGSFIALPVCLAARVLRIPVELYELNVQPGNAIKWLAPFAHTVHTCFKKTQHYFPNYRCAHTDYPVQFDHTDKQRERTDIHNQLHFDAKKTTLFILGGSQGSRFINNVFKQMLEQHPQLHDTVQIIHQIGPHDTAEWQTFYETHNIPAHVFTYEKNMSPYFSAADLVVCRAGAGTLFEALFFNKRCIVIPLETPINNHQLFNAQEMVINYQRLFTMLRQQHIEKNSRMLFDTINKSIIREF